MTHIGYELLLSTLKYISTLKQYYDCKIQDSNCNFWSKNVKNDHSAKCASNTTLSCPLAAIRGSR